MTEPAPSPTATSQTTVIIVVGILGVYALAALAGVIWLISVKADAASVALVSTSGGIALGAVATLLANTRTEPTPHDTAPPPPGA